MNTEDQVEKIMDDELEEILRQYKRGFSNMDNPNHALTKYDIHRAKQALNRLLVEARIEELEKAHRADGTEDADNPTDEYIDDRIAALKKELGLK